jgi:hypothetical protein
LLLGHEYEGCGEAVNGPGKEYVTGLTNKVGEIVANRSRRQLIEMRRHLPLASQKRNESARILVAHGL